MLVDIDNVQVTFGDETALKDISLCVHRGEYIGLIGQNGSGKTTLLKVLLRLLQPSGGTVRRTATATSYIPQSHNLYNTIVPLSVLEVVLLGARGNHPTARQALQNVGMYDAQYKRFNDLSGGQQQRVAIAKAIASGASLLVMDEPTTGIDEQSQATFYSILHDLRQKGMTIIMVSHEVDTVLSLVTRVICLNRTIVYDGPPEHFEADTYMPAAYKARHRKLHHHHEAPNA